MQVVLQPMDGGKRESGSEKALSFVLPKNKAVFFLSNWCLAFGQKMMSLLAGLSARMNKKARMHSSTFLLLESFYSAVNGSKAIIRARLIASVNCR